MSYRKIIFLIGFALVIIGMPFSTAMMSIGDAVIFANWLFDKNLKQKFSDFITNKTALIVSSIFILHLVGLVYTSNFSYAFQDLRTKVPLLIFPMVFSSMSRFSAVEIRNLLYLFSFSVISSLSTSLVILYTQNLTDSRMAFPFGSHIRLGILAVLVLCILLYYLIYSKLAKSTLTYLLNSIGIIALLFLVFSLELMTAWVLLFIVFLVLLMNIAVKKYSKKIIIVFSSVLIFGVVLTSFYVYNLVNDYRTVKGHELNTLPLYSKNGGLYQHDSIHFPIENGSYIGLFVCRDELKQSWEKRSKISYDKPDKSNQLIEYTLIRYLNSKHLTKDQQGVEALTPSDVSAIENGIANVNYLTKNGFEKKIYKILWEISLYETSGIYKGQSVIQRFELWKTSLKICSDYPIFGCGTGDVPDVFHSYLVKQNSALANTRMRSHNQFLSICIAFGIVGLSIFLALLLFPIVKKTNRADFLYLSFFCVLLVSMFWEDTLESQLGLTLFAFFNSFYLFHHLGVERKN